MIDIIIPVFLFNEKIYNITRQCFQSIKDTTHSPFRIIWVDNGSDVRLFQNLKDYIFRHNIYCDVIRNESNLGYTKAINQGIQLATSPQILGSSVQSLASRVYLVLGNNDIIATPGWDEKLIKILKAHPEIGCIVPMTDTASYQCRARLVGQGFSLANSRFVGEYIIAETMVSFNFALFKTEVIQKLGLLDERLANGWGTDRIYCQQMRKAGYLPAISCQTTFHHEHSVSFRHVYGKNLKSERIKAKILRKSLYS